MLDISESQEFWSLPYPEQNRLFHTPCGSGYTCTVCGTLYEYHSGPPTTGGYHSCFADSRLFYMSEDKCCSKSYWDALHEWWKPKKEDES